MVGAHESESTSAVACLLQGFLRDLAFPLLVIVVGN